MKFLNRVLILVFLFLLTGAGYSAQRDLPRRSIPLLPPDLTKGITFEKLIANLHEVEGFTSKPLSTSDIGQLGWAASRSFSSINAQFEQNTDVMKLYFVISTGVFEYEPQQYILKEVTDVDVREKISKSASDDGLIGKSQCSIIVAVESKKSSHRFGLQSEKLFAIEAGRVIQNIACQAAVLKLGFKAINDFDITSVRMLSRLPSFVEPISIVCVGYPAVESDIKVVDSGEEPNQPVMQAGEYRAVFIVSSKYFNEDELFETQKMLENASIETVIASSQKGLITGHLGRNAEAEMTIDEIVVDDFDAIVLIGGVGAKQYFGDKTVLNIVKQAVEKDKVIAAISISPGILANAGVLNGMTVTGSQTERASLKEAGAIYTSGEVERDGLIITAIGPEAAKRFGFVIAEAITPE